MDSSYIDKNAKRLRIGFTTGSCSAAAAKAAALMLFEQQEVSCVRISTPKGLLYETDVLAVKRQADAVTCAVRKDGGDDPDATHGALIYATVSRTAEPGIHIDGGTGVGRVTKPGLDQPIGNAAINSVPRKMIRRELEEVLIQHRAQGGLEVLIQVPQGEEIAKKTFNPKLGIVGGISILGTSGIVEPMSDKAVVDTIRTECSVRAAEGYRGVILAPGNYGLDFLQAQYELDPQLPVMISNFVYDAMCIAASFGFEKVLLCGHIGKLIKVAGGVYNTHSRYGDRRMEILSSLVKEAAPETGLVLEEEIRSCVMTDEAIRIIEAAGILAPVCELMAVRIKGFLEAWAGYRLQTEVIVFSNQHGILAQSSRAQQQIRDIIKHGEGEET